MVSIRVYKAEKVQKQGHQPYMGQKQDVYLLRSIRNAFEGGVICCPHSRLGV